MTDFVLQQGNPSNTDSQFADKIMSYAHFLKQPLTIGMFVPCDEDGNVLEECDKIKEYRKAKEKVLFEGLEKFFFELKEHDVFVVNEKIFSTKDFVENLLEYKGLEFHFTPNAIKRIFG